MAKVDALGLMIQLSDPTFVLTALMLIDMLSIMKPLTLWLQSSPAAIDITQLPVIVGNVVDKLNYIAGVDDNLRAKFTQREIAKLHFNKSQFEGKCAIISKAIESLPAAARLRNNSQKQNLDQQFDEFQISVQQPFVREIAQEISRKICLDPVTAALRCLDVRHFPGHKTDLVNYGEAEMKILCDHFGEAMEAAHPKTLIRNRCDPKINKVAAIEEYEIYKTCAYEINSERSRCIKQEIRTMKRSLSATLTVASNKQKIISLKQKISEQEALIDKMPLSEMYQKLCESGRAFLFPNMLVLLEVAILCPVGNATVERLFSFMKLVKTRLRNSLGDSSLDSLLRIKMECKEKLEDEDLEVLVDMFKDYVRELTKSGVIRVEI